MLLLGLMQSLFSFAAHVMTTTESKE